MGEPPNRNPHLLCKPDDSTPHGHRHYAAALALDWMQHHVGIDDEDMQDVVDHLTASAYDPDVAEDHEALRLALDQIEAVLFLHDRHMHPADYNSIYHQLATAKRALAVAGGPMFAVTAPPGACG